MYCREVNPTAITILHKVINDFQTKAVHLPIVHNVLVSIFAGIFRKNEKYSFELDVM
jgi:hypothetical protein